MLTEVKLSTGPENTVGMGKYQVGDPENKTKQILKRQNNKEEKKKTTRKHFKKHRNQFQEFHCLTIGIPERKEKR